MWAAVNALNVSLSVKASVSEIIRVRGSKWIFNVNLYMNTEWNFFAEKGGSSNNNFRDAATPQALGSIPISFSFQNRKNLMSQILKNFQLVQT